MSEGQDLHVDFLGSLRDLSPSPRTFRLWIETRSTNCPTKTPPIRRACPPTSGRLQQTALSWVKPPHPPRLRSHRRILRLAARRAPPRLLRSRRHRRPPAVTDPPRDPERPPRRLRGPRRPDRAFPHVRPTSRSLLPAGRLGPPRYRPTSQLRTHRSSGRAGADGALLLVSSAAWHSVHSLSVAAT
jgi:hypothetical protein